MSGVESMVPGWAAVGAAGVAMAVIATHTLALQRAAMPASRRRIRTANGLVMLMLAPVLAYALGLATPDQTRSFVLAWGLVMGLTGVVLMLAGLDMLNTLRLLTRQRSAVRAQRHHARAGSTRRPEPVVGGGGGP